MTVIYVMTQSMCGMSMSALYKNLIVNSYSPCVLCVDALCTCGDYLLVNMVMLLKYSIFMIVKSWL